MTKIYPQNFNLPYNFTPRNYQIPLLAAIDEKNMKRAFALWHRRAGKDLCLWNLMIKRAFLEPGLYYYFLPTYAQAKKIIWDGMTIDGIKFLDCIPKQIVNKSNDQELKITISTANGMTSIIQLIGTDSFDSIRGTNPRGCVFSEYAYQSPMAWEVVKPILKVNRGWAVFNTTPQGENHAFDLWNIANENKEEWFTEKLTIENTNILTEQDMEEERRGGMTEEMIQQEYYCSFSIGAIGSYYSKQMEEAEKTNHITTIPYQKGVPTDLYLDLGKNDSTSIGFVQRVGLEIRIIDHLEASNEEIAYYIKELHKKPYDYGFMYLPHDATHKRLQSNKTIEDQFRDGGFKTRIVEKAEINNGIQELRKIFNRIWFDKDKTQKLRKALKNYHREWDQEKKVFKDHPMHDWSSNSADMMRYMAIGYKEPSRNPQQIKKRATGLNRFSAF
jgi:hypothetical protein